MILKHLRNSKSTLLVIHFNTSFRCILINKVYFLIIIYRYKSIITNLI
nr:MAG TPA: hypothetical protein [Caudoviricetes sp.]